MDPRVYFPKLPEKAMQFLVNRMYTLKVSKAMTNKARFLDLEAGRLQNSGKFGIYRPGSYGIFTLECYRPCELNSEIKAQRP